MSARETKDINNFTVVRWIVLSFTIVLAGFVLWLTREIVLLTLTAAIIAILLTTPVRFFVRIGVRRALAVILTVGLIIVVITIAVVLLVPDLFGQFRILAEQTLPRAWDLLQRELTPEALAKNFPWLKGSGIDLTEVTRQISQQLVSGLGTLPGQVFPFLGNLRSTLVSILVVLFLAFYFVADPDTHWRPMLRLVPIRYRIRAREILARLDLTLRRFLQAQVLIMLLTGTATTLALVLMRMPLAGALGVITGLFSFVPNFGPVISLIPIVAVATINTPNQILWVVIVFFVIQFVISQIVAPLLFGSEMNLPPALILLSQIIAGIFFGFLGLLLSVPLAAIVTVLVREIYVRDILGDTEVAQRRTLEGDVVSGVASAPPNPLPATASSPPGGPPRPR
jgi:predicted PurR-regulated permease PerM